MKNTKERSRITEWVWTSEKTNTKTEQKKAVVSYSNRMFSEMDRRMNDHFANEVYVQSYVI